jgi:Rad3-related DNA helicase
MSVTYNDLIKFFPHQNIREIQQQALYKCAEFLNNDKKYLILELPPGVGKSAIGMTIARYFKNKNKSTYYITPQKILQDQYANEFKDIAIIKGKKNYRCLHDPFLTCDYGACEKSSKQLIKPELTYDTDNKENNIKNKKSKQKCINCPYKIAVEDAFNSSISLFNFDGYYLHTNFSKFSSQERNLLIIDECHKIENKMINLYSLSLSKKEHSDLPEYKNIHQYQPYLIKLRMMLEQNINDNNQQLNLVTIDNTLLDRLLKERDKNIDKISKIEKILNNIEHDWVINTEYNFDKTFKGIEIKKLYVNDVIPSYIFKKTPKIILMSATIINPKEFCTYNGIPYNSAMYFNAGSPFNINNRKIYIIGSGSMSMKNFDFSKKMLVEDIKRIINHHKNDRGIIHTYSNKIANFIRDTIIDDRIIVKDDKHSIEYCLNKLKESKNGIIVGSAMEEGLDLKDDLSRFQIISKIPYPNLGDNQIRIRKDNDKEYYQYLTILTLCQAYGRSIRTHTDYANTYILDSDFSRLTRNCMPKWFNEAITLDSSFLYT